MNYWLNINKPKYITSAKVSNIIKKKIGGVYKVGHCGTLDPYAEGVLPIAIGESTKLVEYVMNNFTKEYLFSIKFGYRTDTGDFGGNVIDKAKYIPSIQELQNVVNIFLGEIIQTPHPFSAIKINGIRSYKLARTSNDVLLKKRKIIIYELNFINFNKIDNIATYLVKCSKGTYVRSLAEDIAFYLQSLGFVIQLKRLSVGMFNLSKALDLSSFMFLDNDLVKKMLQKNHIALASVLYNVPVFNVSYESASMIKHGIKNMKIVDVHKNIDFVRICYAGCIIAIGNIKDGLFNSLRVFNL